MVGDLLYATIYSYLALNDVHDQVQSRAAGVIDYRLPSYGIFSTRLQTNYWFGLPRNVSFNGLSMDVDHLATQSITKDNDWDRTVNFIRATGIRASVLEHLVPEQMFSTVDNPAQGISAVKTLAIASSEGQRIWTIDQTNLNTALAAINLDADIENEIRSAVNAGKVATAHDTPVAFAGSTVTGYLLIDPATGAGAYKTGSGANGSQTETRVSDLINWLANYGTDILGQLGDAGARALSSLYTSLRAVLSFFQLITSGNCPLSVAIAGIVSISILIGQFSVLTTAASAANIVYGLGVVVLAAYVVGQVTQSFVERCR